LLVVVYLLDVATKILIRTHLPLGGEVSVLPFFSLVHVTNTGVAFGLFQGRNYFVAVAGLVFSAFMVGAALRYRREDPFLTAVLGLILAGAWGNLTDRIVFGRVTDFLDFFWGVHHWPAFNVADSAICVGAALLIYDNLKSPPMGEKFGGGR
jgi:signal peptidase II